MQKILSTYLTSLSSRIENNSVLSIDDISSIVLLASEGLKEHKKEMETWIRSEVSRAGESCVLNPRIRSLMYKKRRIAFCSSRNWGKPIDAVIASREYDVQSLSLFLVPYLFARLGWDVEIFVSEPRIHIAEEIQIPKDLLCTEVTLVDHSSTPYLNPYCLPGTNPILKDIKTIGSSFPFDIVIMCEVVDAVHKIKNVLKPTGKLFLWTEKNLSPTGITATICSSVPTTTSEVPNFVFSPYLLDCCRMDTNCFVGQGDDKFIESDRIESSCIVCLTSDSTSRLSTSLVSTWLTLRSFVPQAILLVLIPSGIDITWNTSLLERMREQGITLRKNVDVRTIVTLMKTYSIYLQIESTSCTQDPYLLMAQGAGMVPVCLESPISKFYCQSKHLYPDLSNITSILASTMTTKHDRDDIRNYVAHRNISNEVSKLNEFLCSFIPSD